MRIACAQFDIAWNDKDANFGKARKMIGDAAGRRADVIVLPETFSTGTLKGVEARDTAESMDGEAVSFMKELARDNQVWLIGSFIEKGKPLPYNTCVVVDRAGKVCVKYRKMHLFTFKGEDKDYSPGTEVCTFKIEGNTAGLMVCYDLRFPELARALALKGARALFVPANWGVTYKHIFSILLRARAAENQLFVAGANRIGDSPHWSYEGRSALIDALGKAVAEGGEGEELVFGEFDFSQLEKVRRDVPVFRDRKPEIYARFLK